MLEVTWVSMNDKITAAKLCPGQEQPRAGWRDKEVKGFLRANGHNQNVSSILGIVTYSPVVQACSFLPKQSFCITGSQKVPVDLSQGTTVNNSWFVLKH